MPEYAPKKRFLNDVQCKTSAYHIAGEMEAYAEGRAELHHIWTPALFDIKAGGSITPKKLPRSVPSGALIKTGRDFWLFAIVESLARGALSYN